MLDKELPDPELKEYTSIIVSEAERLGLLVDRMLGPNKLTDFKPTNIYEVFERVIQIVEAENPNKNSMGSRLRPQPSGPRVRQRPTNSGHLEYNPKRE